MASYYADNTHKCDMKAIKPISNLHPLWTPPLSTVVYPIAHPPSLPGTDTAHSAEREREITREEEEEEDQYSSFARDTPKEDILSRSGRTTKTACCTANC